MCLPPYTVNAELYQIGIAVFAEIYFAFEREWLDTIKASNQSACVDARMISVLGSLYIPSLCRSGRLQADIRRLRQRTTNNLDLQALTSPISERITQNIRSKPHKLIAYSWILYMALFNGGRWIRGQLQCAGPEFWNAATLPESIDCLSFWDFDDEKDGEDIKCDFKRRIEKISELLSTAERVDIVAEAVLVFQMCQSLVDQLDELVQLQKTSESATPVTNSVGSISQSKVTWSWLWKLEGIWNSRLWGNDFWLRREVHVQP